jgi:hypothetical protein
MVVEPEILKEGLSRAASFMIQNNIKFKVLNEGDFMRKDIVIFSPALVMAFLTV